MLLREDYLMKAAGAASSARRHFYAMNAMRFGVSVFEVARDMGTPVQIIQAYYGKQATSAVFATRLGD
jgi:hypothetical protein